MCNIGSIILILIAIVFGLVSMGVLVLGYAPNPIYGGDYKPGIGNLTGYNIVQDTCYEICNCYAVGRNNVCDYCKYTCYYAYIYYSVNADVTFNIQKGPNGVDPTQFLQSIESEIVLYYKSDGSVIYGNDLKTIRNCFIAGMVLIGLCALLILASIIIGIVIQKLPPPPPLTPDRL